MMFQSFDDNTSPQSSASRPSSPDTIPDLDQTTKITLLDDEELLQAGLRWKF